MNWLRYSGIWITLVVNPLHWRFSFKTDSETVLSAPKLRECTLQLGLIVFRIALDDGSW